MFMMHTHCITSHHRITLSIVAEKGKYKSFGKSVSLDIQITTVNGRDFQYIQAMWRELLAFGEPEHTTSCSAVPWGTLQIRILFIRHSRSQKWKVGTLKTNKQTSTNPK